MRVTEKSQTSYRIWSKWMRLIDYLKNNVKHNAKVEARDEIRELQKVIGQATETRVSGRDRVFHMEHNAREETKEKLG